MFGKKPPAISPDDVRAVLDKIIDPEAGKGLVEAGFVKDVAVDGQKVRIGLTLPTPAWASRPELAAKIPEQLAAAGDKLKVDIAWGSDVLRSRPEAAGEQNLVPGARNLILFASGKGGVGKSTVASNVAAALAHMGANVGLLDADVYGPSIPTMLGTHERPEVSGQKLVPVVRHGMKLMSIGFIVPPTEAMVWRGPMLAGALTQFMRDVEWGDLDYLIMDLPPGTGDVQLTLAQNVKVSGAVLVSTPQDVALADVRRGKAMFDKVGIQTLGVVENMAYFDCGSCGARHNIFNSGGATRLADELGVPVVGEVPLETSTREAADQGRPEVLAHPDSSSAKAFNGIARTLATMLAKKAMSQPKQKASGLKIIQ